MSQSLNAPRQSRPRHPLNVLRKLRMRGGSPVGEDDLTEFFGEDLSDENDRYIESITRNLKGDFAC